MTIEVSREKFKSTVAAGLARANNEMHDVLGELRIYNKERRQETPEVKNEPNSQILSRMTDREYYRKPRNCGALIFRIPAPDEHNYRRLDLRKPPRDCNLC